MAAGPGRSVKLNAGFVSTVKRPGRYGDGRGSYGLALLVRPRAGGGVRKSWIQRIRIGGRLTNIGLGSYPLVKLSEARRKAFDNRRLAEQGQDPRGGGVPTFAEAAEQVIQLYSKGWKPGSKTEHRWRSTLTIYAYPTLGSKRVDRITTADIMGLLAPIWHEKNPTAQTVKREISAIMRWAVAAGYRSDNPAGDAITAALPKHGSGSRHHPALPHDHVAAALQQVRGSSAYPTSVLLLEYQILTATRPTEARLAQWLEIDFEKATWTIPAKRTKKSREHRVPLSTRAIAILHEAHQYRNSSGLIFPCARGGQMGKGTVGAILHRLGIPCVPHGFRSSFRVWVEECTDTPGSVAEAALAHQNRNQVEAAYLRTDLFDRRRRLMEAWATYLQQGLDALSIAETERAGPE